MEKLILFTSKDCPKCPSAKRVVQEVCEKLGIKYRIIKIDEGDNLLEALQYQIAGVPSIVIDGEPEFRNEIPTPEELEEKLKE